MVVQSRHGARWAHRSAEDVDEERVEAAGAVEEEDDEREVEHAHEGAEGVQAAQDVTWQPIAVDVDTKRAVLRLAERVLGIAVRREHLHLEPLVLQPHRRIHHETLGAADAEVGVQERHALRHRHARSAPCSRARTEHATEPLHC